MRATIRPPRTLALATLTLLMPLAAGRAAGADPPLPDDSRLGLHVQSMTPELREHFEAPADRGLLVTRVESGRPAARAGVAVGDVILEAGGVPQRSTWDLVRVVGRAPTGEKLVLRVLRKGKPRTLEVVPDGPAIAWPDPEAFAEWLERGFALGSEELRHQLHQLEKRLEELERKIEEERESREGAERT